MRKRAPAAAIATRPFPAQVLPCFPFGGSYYDALPAIALAQQAAAAARARADAAGPSLKKPSAFLAESSDEGEARPPKDAPALKSAAVAGQATLFSFLQGKAK